MQFNSSVSSPSDKCSFFFFIKLALRYKRYFKCKPKTDEHNIFQLLYNLGRWYLLKVLIKSTSCCKQLRINHCRRRRILSIFLIAYQVLVPLLFIHPECFSSRTKYYLRSESCDSATMLTVKFINNFWCLTPVLSTRYLLVNWLFSWTPIVYIKQFAVNP